VFVVGDVVRDKDLGSIGTVRSYAAGVLDLQNRVGRSWRAMAVRCELITPAAAASGETFPPATCPLTATPDTVRVGDWVRLEDGRAYQIRDMRAAGPGGRVLHLDGRARPWVMPTGARQVYRPVGT
jgi:hypothetical protein